MITVGIDVGGSTTKIVGFSSDKTLIKPIFVKANDPVTSIYGALGRFTVENGCSLSDIGKIMITGVGSSKVSDSLYSIPCFHVSEFESVARGGIYLSGLDKAIIASMGTGTALVYAEKNGINEYLGGTGVGGGTIGGLCKLLLGMYNIGHISELAGEGNLSNVDLRISDISSDDKKLGLPGEMTAANFGNVSDIASKADIAMGTINIVIETVGMMCIFAARAHNTRDIVLTGHISTIAQSKERFEILSKMFDLNFVIPEMSQFATVIGAALQGTQD